MPVNWAWQKIDEHLIQPFLLSHAPVHLVARGAVVGMFVGLTPTVGAQMYIVTVIWVFFRYILRFNFNLPISVALVWLSNPATVVPIYYVFLLTGDWLLGLVGGFVPERDIAHFRDVVLGQASDSGTDGFWERLVHGFFLLFWEFGWPMAVGSLLWAVPFSVISYPVVSIYMHKFRKRKADREGITYEEWQARHVRVD